MQQPVSVVNAAVELAVPMQARSFHLAEQVLGLVYQRVEPSQVVFHVAKVGRMPRHRLDVPGQVLDLAQVAHHLVVLRYLAEAKRFGLDPICLLLDLQSEVFHVRVFLGKRDRGDGAENKKQGECQKSLVSSSHDLGSNQVKGVAG
jgi:hypothetical protein